MSIDDNVAEKVGRLDGRLIALEGRADRFEATVQGRLTSIDNKLEAIAASLAAGGGARKGISDLIRWGVSVGTAASGWIYTALHLHI